MTQLDRTYSSFFPAFTGHSEVPMPLICLGMLQTNPNVPNLNPETKQQQQ